MGKLAAGRNARSGGQASSILRRSDIALLLKHLRRLAKKHREQFVLACWDFLPAWVTHLGCTYPSTLRCVKMTPTIVDFHFSVYHPCTVESRQLVALLNALATSRSASSLSRSRSTSVVRSSLHPRRNIIPTSTISKRCSQWRSSNAFISLGITKYSVHCQVHLRPLPQQKKLIHRGNVIAPHLQYCCVTE